MPYINGPACVLGDCAPGVFPQADDVCVCTPATGGINELYFIPCAETLSADNVLDLDWWQARIDAGLGRSGAGLGSIAKKTTTTDRTASCRVAQVTSVTWALKFVIKCWDKTSQRSTNKKVTELMTNASKYILVARMCDGDETLLPVGVFDTTDFDWTVPDNFEENQSVMFELSWKEFALPETVDVPGLAAILPKVK